VFGTPADTHSCPVSAHAVCHRSLKQYGATPLDLQSVLSTAAWAATHTGAVDPIMTSTYDPLSTALTLTYSVSAHVWRSSCINKWCPCDAFATRSSLQWPCVGACTGTHTSATRAALPNGPCLRTGTLFVALPLYRSWQAPQPSLGPGQHLPQQQVGMACMQCTTDSRR
jgi:hypothetical protein